MRLGWFIQASLVCSLLAASGCGNSDNDGGTPDAGGDTEVVIPTMHGQVFFLDTSFLGLDFLGKGPLFVFDIKNPDELVRPVYEQYPGSPFGCKVFQYTAAEFNDPGIDIGTIQFELTEGATFPPCNYVEGQGYRCVGVAGGGGNIATAGMDNLYTLTDANLTFGQEQLGRHLLITGSAAPQNNGLFSIVDAPADDTIVFFDPANQVVGEEPTEASYLTLAGFGPSGPSNSGQVPDGALLTASLTANPDSRFTDFEVSTNVGDSFTLDDVSEQVMADIPLDGSEFSLSCDGAGGSCGDGVGSALIIDTTDADVSMAPPHVLPPPVTSATRIACLFLVGEVTVSAEVSQFLAEAERTTRVRTIFAKANPANVNQPDAKVNIAAGNALGAIKTLP